MNSLFGLQALRDGSCQPRIIVTGRVSSPFARFPAGRRKRSSQGAGLEQQQSPASRTEAIRRLGRRLAGYYTGTVAPGASRAARAKSAGKALAASAAVGLVLLAAYSIVLIPFTPGTVDLRKAKSDQPSVLMSIDGKRIATFRRSN